MSETPRQPPRRKSVGRQRFRYCCLFRNSFSCFIIVSAIFQRWNFSCHFLARDARPQLPTSLYGIILARCEQLCSQLPFGTLGCVRFFDLLRAVALVGVPTISVDGLLEAPRLDIPHLIKLLWWVRLEFHLYIMHKLINIEAVCATP